jgi:hypothetical protein
MVFLLQMTFLPFGSLNFVLAVSKVAFSDFAVASLVSRAKTLTSVWVGSSAKEISRLIRAGSPFNTENVATVVISLLSSILSIYFIAVYSKRFLERVAAEEQRRAALGAAAVSHARAADEQDDEDEEEEEEEAVVENDEDDGNSGAPVEERRAGGGALGEGARDDEDGSRVEPEPRYPLTGASPGAGEAAHSAASNGALQIAEATPLAPGGMRSGAASPA